MHKNFLHNFKRETVNDEAEKRRKSLGAVRYLLRVLLTRKIRNFIKQKLPIFHFSKARRRRDAWNKDVREEMMNDVTAFLVCREKTDLWDAKKVSEYDGLIRGGSVKIYTKKTLLSQV